MEGEGLVLGGVVEEGMVLEEMVLEGMVLEGVGEEGIVVGGMEELGLVEGDLLPDLGDEEVLKEQAVLVQEGRERREWRDENDPLVSRLEQENEEKDQEDGEDEEDEEEEETVLLSSLPCTFSSLPREIQLFIFRLLTSGNSTPAHLHTCTPARLHACTPARLHACTPVHLYTCFSSPDSPVSTCAPMSVRPNEGMRAFYESVGQVI